MLYPPKAIELCQFFLTFLSIKSRSFKNITRNLLNFAVNHVTSFSAKNS